MSKKYVIPFEEIGKEDISVVGKKCANLGEMLKIGMPVVPGFALSVEAHKLFMEETGAAQEIREYLSSLPKVLAGMTQYQEVSKAICQILGSKKFPQVLIEQVRENYKVLCRKRGLEEGLSVAVRSAGTVSHPGQYETFLNVIGEAEVFEKIVKVWSSAYNVPSVAAVSKEGLSVADSPYIGVGVLPIIRARAAGVVFTSHPTSGDRSQIIIEGSWGMGESVVSGAVTPDLFVVDKESLAVRERVIGSKAVQLVCAEQGIIEEEVPEELRCSLCLTDDEVRKIAELALRLERHFGRPQDGEWAVDSQSSLPNNIYYMQTRPQAALAETKSAADQLIDLMLCRLLGA